MYNYNKRLKHTLFALSVAITALIIPIHAMEDINPIEQKHQAVVSLISKEQAALAKNSIDDREDFWDIIEKTQEAFDRAISKGTPVPPEESIELLKFAFCGVKEIGIRAYIEQEEQRFVDLFNIILRKGLNPLRAECIQQGIDLNFVFQLGICNEAAGSIGYKFVRFGDLQNRKRAMFWFLVAESAYHHSDNLSLFNAQPSHYVQAISQNWKKIIELKNQ
jgi:hypothetical protein